MEPHAPLVTTVLAAGICLVVVLNASVSQERFNRNATNIFNVFLSSSSFRDSVEQKGVASGSAGVAYKLLHALVPWASVEVVRGSRYVVPLLLGSFMATFATPELRHAAAGYVTGRNVVVDTCCFSFLTFFGWGALVAVGACSPPARLAPRARSVLAFLAAYKALALLVMASGSGHEGNVPVAVVMAATLVACLVAVVAAWTGGTTACRAALAGVFVSMWLCTSFDRTESTHIDDDGDDDSHEFGWHSAVFLLGGLTVAALEVAMRADRRAVCAGPCLPWCGNGGASLGKRPP